MKKKLLALTLASAMALSASLTGCGSSQSTEVVNVYNWNVYIDESIFDTFEEETGIKVNYNTYDSNEILYSTLQNGTSDYDVIIPSDYMIGRMIAEDMLEPLNFDNIPNYSYIDDAYRNLEYDPDNTYSVPYMWGVLGIIYNTTMVSSPITSWQTLFDETYAGQVLMFDNSRDTIGIALKALGYSYNTTDPAQITEAVDLLVKQKEDGIVQAYVMDQIFDKLEGGEAAIGVYYGGDALTMMEVNPDLGYVVPSEGSNLYVDAMCIPKGAAHKDNAEAFINFMCRPEISALNAVETSYSVPSSAARDLLDDDLKDSAIAYPDSSVLANCEVYTNLPDDILSLYDSEWGRLKNAAN